jgi:hypothetical protein
MQSIEYKPVNSSAQRRRLQQIYFQTVESLMIFFVDIFLKIWAKKNHYPIGQKGRDWLDFFKNINLKLIYLFLGSWCKFC